MFEKPFSFEGRIRRTELGISYIIYAVIIGIINVTIESNRDDLTFLFIFYIPLLWFLWAQNAKRCHDVGNSGWWQLIPLYGFWLLFQDGQAGQNQYGDNPKGIQASSHKQQSGQTYKNNQTTGSSSTYQGGYSGGHNNPSQNYNSNTNIERLDNNRNQEGYKNGDLYK